MFSSERQVMIDIPGGERASALVDKTQVIVEQDPQSDALVDGHIRVSVVEFENDSVIVDLHGVGIVNGTRIEIPKTFLKRRR